MQTENIKPTIGKTIGAIFKSLLIIALILLLSGVLAPMVPYFLPGIPEIIQAYVAIILVYIVTLFFIFFVRADGPFFKQYKEKLHIRKFKPFDILKIIGFVAISILAAGVSTVIIALALHATNSSQNANITTQSLVNGLSGVWKIFGMVLIPSILAPFFEEAIFRQGMGYIFKVEQGGSKVAFLITESILFGLLHAQLTGTPVAIVQAIIVPMIGGFIFGLIYLKYKTFWYSYLTHSLYNLVVVLITFMIAMH